MGFQRCRCSHCDKAGCDLILKYMSRLNIENFEDALKEPTLLPDLVGYSEENLIDHSAHRKCASKLPVHEPELESLVIKLLKTYEDHHRTLFNSSDRLRPKDYFSEEDACRISSQIDSIEVSEDIFNIMKCDILKGGVDKLFESSVDWRNGLVCQRRVEDLMDKQREMAKAAEEARKLARWKEEEKQKRTEDHERKKRLQKEKYQMIQDVRKRKAGVTLEAKKKAKEVAKVNKQMIQRLKDGLSL